MDGKCDRKDYMQKLYLPVKEFHRGNTATYLERALAEVDLSGQIIGEEQFALLLQTEPEAFFLCVDSGGVFNFEAEQFQNLNLERVAYWLIDFRHHQTGPRVPSDLALCESLHSRGGTIFQAQAEDVAECLRNGWHRTHHLRLAADPEIWCDTPEEKKLYHLAFAGNVWDQGRAKVLQSVMNIPGLRFGYPGHGSLWMEDAARFLRQSQVGFNVNSWYGSGHDFDLNMRFFETLSCGIPLITNWVPELEKLFDSEPPFVASYKDASELPNLIVQKLQDKKFLESGPDARKWVLKHATYKLRLEEVKKIWVSNFDSTKP